MTLEQAIEILTDRLDMLVIYEDGYYMVDGEVFTEEEIIDEAELQAEQNEIDY